MARWRVSIDPGGIGRILRSPEAHALTNEAAQRVAAAVALPDDDGDVVVESYTTDRGAAAVVVRHPEAVGLQAKYGILSAAASTAGLRIQGRGS